MLNQYLPIGNIHQNLEEYLESWDFLLKQINPENITPIFQDSKLLSSLHHALNIDKYKQKKFREELFQYAPDKKIIDFAKEIGIKFSSFEETQTHEFRKYLAGFRWGSNEQTKKFLKIFEYSDYLLPKEIEDEDAKKFFPKLADPLKPLKDYQSEVFFNTQKIIEFPNVKFLIQMPTGAGKTRVAMEIISSFLNNKEGRQVVWLADRSELCEQAVEAFENCWSHLGKVDLTLHRMWGGNTLPKKIEGTSFIVAMYQKIREPLKKKTLELKGDLIMTDEAHNAIAKTHNETIERLKDFKNKQTRVLGLTATPGRSDNSQNKKLVSFFDNKIIGIDSKEIGVISYLQRKKILARCIREKLETKIKYTLTNEEWRKLAKSFEHEYPEELLKRIANDNGRNAIILFRLIELAKNHNHVLVFGATKKQSKLLCG